MFVGRKAIVDMLFEEFKITSIKKKPRLVLITADSGVGKTRTLQEFYNKLVVSQNSLNYWKPINENLKHSESIVPTQSEINTVAVSELSFIWFGLQNYENNKGISSLYTLKDQIEIHMASIFGIKLKNEINSKLRKLIITTLMNYIVPCSGILLENSDAMNSFLDLYNICGFKSAIKEISKNLKHSQSSNNSESNIIKIDGIQNLIDTTLDIISLMYDKEIITTPIILVIDDYQWCDNQTNLFLCKIIEKSISNSYPILFVISSWEQYLKLCTFKNNTCIKYILEAFNGSSLDIHTTTISLPQLNKKNSVKILNNYLDWIDDKTANYIIKKSIGDTEMLMTYIELLTDIEKDLRVEYSYSDFLNLINENTSKKQIVKKRFEKLDELPKKILSIGSLQGLEFSYSFIEKCIKKELINDSINTNFFKRLDNPMNIALVTDREFWGSIATYRKYIYFEVTNDFFARYPLTYRLKFVRTLLEHYSVNINDKFQIYSIKTHEYICLKVISLIEEYNLKNEFKSLYEQATVKLLIIKRKNGDFNAVEKNGISLIEGMNNKSPVYNKILYILLDTAISKLEYEKAKQILNTYASTVINTNVQLMCYKASIYKAEDATIALKIINNAIRISKENNTDYLTVKALVEKLNILFYAGHTIEVDILYTEINNNYNNKIEADFKLNLEFKHALSLNYINLDLNSKIVKLMSNCKNEYELISDRIYYLMASFNLSEGLCGEGSFFKAISEGQAVIDSARDLNDYSILNLALIIQGNNYSAIGNFSKAEQCYKEGLSYYDNYLNMLEYLYGNIYYQLLCGENGNKNAFKELKILEKKSKKLNYKYLEALSVTFQSILLAYNLNSDFKKKIENLDKKIPSKFPGLRMQYLSILILFRIREEQKYNIIIEFINLSYRCEGVKGRLVLVEKAIREILLTVDLDKKHILQLKYWLNEYCGKK